MASTLPAPNAPISFGSINTELGLSFSRTISMNDVMTRALHGSYSGTQISMDQFSNAYAIGNPYLPNAQTRIIIDQTSPNPCLTRSVLRVAVAAMPTQNVTPTNQESQQMYDIIKVTALPATAGPPAVANAFTSILMNANHSATVAAVSIRNISTAYAIALTGNAAGVENITSADALEFVKIKNGTALVTTAPKAAQIQTATIIEYNRYIRGTTANGNHVLAGFLNSV